MIKQAHGWQRNELEQIQADSMDAERLRNLIANIDASLASLHSPIDAKKLRELKSFFELELKKRGES